MTNTSNDAKDNLSSSDEPTGPIKTRAALAAKDFETLFGQSHNGKINPLYTGAYNAK
jgi:hypothetical protein